MRPGEEQALRRFVSKPPAISSAVRRTEAGDRLVNDLPLTGVVTARCRPPSTTVAVLVTLAPLIHEQSELVALLWTHDTFVTTPRRPEKYA